MTYRYTKLLFVAICFCFSAGVNATMIFSNGAGSAVTNVDRLATFDSLTAFNVADLSTYTESSLNIQSQVSWANHPLCGSTNGCWYANGGINNPNFWTTISGTDGASLQAIEFQINSGGGLNTHNTFKWETYNNGALLASDSYTYGGSDIYGFLDTAGFDELRVAVVGDVGGNTTMNTIGIDNLKVQLLGQSNSAPNAVVPTPTSIPLLIIGLFSFFVSSRKKT